jgi:hypothetical protein
VHALFEFEDGTNVLECGLQFLGILLCEIFPEEFGNRLYELFGLGERGASAGDRY